MTGFFMACSHHVQGDVPCGTWRKAKAFGMVRDPAARPMSWSELERFVEELEGDAALRRAVKHCRSRKELILAARRLGYRITRIDLQRAWQEEQREQQAGAPAFTVPLA